jgi:AcrR family transcriptional regulator
LRTYHHGDLRNALIREGRAALEETSPHELSLRLIARRAGVSEAAPSRHFAGLNDLLATIAAQGFGELHGDRMAVQAGDDTPRRKMLGMMRCYVNFARANRGLFGLMVGPRIVQREAHADLYETSKRSFELFARSVIDFARECGWPAEADSLLVHAAWSVEHGAAVLINNNRVPGFDYDVQVDDMVDFSLGMLASGIERGPGDFPPRSG